MVVNPVEQKKTPTKLEYAFGAKINSDTRLNGGRQKTSSKMRSYVFLILVSSRADLASDAILHPVVIYTPRPPADSIAMVRLSKEFNVVAGTFYDGGA